MDKSKKTTNSKIISGAVAVAGAGIAGMQAALDLANAGFKVYLLEKNVSIGGIMAQLDKTFPTNDCSTCMISPKLIEIANNPNIEIISRAEILKLNGEPGDFTLSVHKASRFIDEDACTGCGDCIKVCPVEVPADFNQGLNQRKAIFRHFPQAVPGTFAIDKRGTSPCKDACPAGISVQGYVALIAQGKYKEAMALIRRDNPLPAVCGRVCTHPCEAACSRAEIDMPIAIRDLKRFVSDWEIRQGGVDLPELPLPRPEKIAIIGAGPAGLAAAFYLALEGIHSTIFEALPVAGGMLRVGIPAYRLPRAILEYEIENIRRLGVEIHLNTPIGGELTLSALREQGFAALFLATGAHRALSLNLEGQYLPGVLSGVEFLRDCALEQAACPGERVAVIGGGSVAVDAARTALRLGSRRVSILYRRTRSEMPAYTEEIEEALKEGVNIEFLTMPTRFVAGPGGCLQAVEVTAMELSEPDASGRHQSRPLEGSKRLIELDAVISAIGQKPDLGFLEEKLGLIVDRGITLRADPLTLQTSLPWVFAGGDLVRGPDTVVQAIAHGKAAAISIDRFLKGQDLAAGRRKERTLAQVDTAGLPKVVRYLPPVADPIQRRRDFREVLGAFDKEIAQTEAKRCLACGICSECYQCLSVCRAGAIHHNMQPTELSLKVGALVLSPGFIPFDPALRPEYGYGRWANVVTSLEFERMLSASGPSGGHLRRPRDGREPRRVAWIQCVGSRDASIGRHYCSYVCCMYACKQAIIAGEHVKGLEPTIFYIDVRAQGKGFDRYYERAKAYHGVRYVRSLISRVVEDPASGDLIISYHDYHGQLQEEIFNLMVLSVGLDPNSAGVELARRLEVATDQFGFAARVELNPLQSSRQGVYICGAFQAPHDIPDTVMQASGAAAEVGALLARARGSEITSLDYPSERPVDGQAPRVGVFVCHCGVNIGGVVNVPEVVEYIKELPNVVEAQDYLFACSTDSQKKMAQIIAERGLNRVVVASCSPRTHEGLFRDMLRRAGLNPYLFEMANIRDQCSWVHAADHPAATEKAKDLTLMSVSRARLLAPLRQLPAPVEQIALVVGGGPAGLTAALNLASQGFFTHLVEKTDRLGGLARRLEHTAEGFAVQLFLDDLIDQTRNHSLIKIHLNSELGQTTGHVGQFVSLLKGADKADEIRHGAIVIATGAAEHRPQEFGFGQNPRVLTQLELHQALVNDSQALKDVGSVVMIQCVGSRTPEHSYCSRICCTQAVSNALRIKQLQPAIQVSVLFRDMRTFSLKELYYRQAREAGVNFIRFSSGEVPQVRGVGQRLLVRVFDQTLRQWIRLDADRLVLAAAVRPRPDARELADVLKLPLDADGFFMEAHLKLKPVDFINAGVFLAGTANGPKFLEEVIVQAKAAAARAATVLSHKQMLVGSEVAAVDGQRCVACLTCVRTCPFGVPQLGPDGVIHIDPAACHGCGNCASACPRKLIEVQHHTDAQILAKTIALWEQIA